jgi:hypothetical protein
MASRDEQIGLNHGIRLLRPYPSQATERHSAITELNVAGGTEGSNPAPSSGESTANLAAPRGSNDHVTQIDPDAEPDPAFRYETTQNPPTWAVGVVLGDGRNGEGSRACWRVVDVRTSL